MSHRTAYILCVALALLTVSCARQQAGPNPPPPRLKDLPPPPTAGIEGKRVLFVIAPRAFRDEELTVTRKVLEEAGAMVEVASRTTATVTGMLGAEVRPDLALSDVHAEDWDAVVFVGGAGATDYYNDLDAHRVASEALHADRVVGAICLAPSILAHAGLLEGRQVTGWESEAPELRRSGAEYTGDIVTRDGKLVTAKGPQVATAFAKALATVLAGG